MAIYGASEENAATQGVTIGRKLKWGKFSKLCVPKGCRYGGRRETVRMAQGRGLILREENVFGTDVVQLLFKCLRIWDKSCI